MRIIKDFNNFIKEQSVDFGKADTIEYDINKLLYESLGSSSKVIINSKILCDRLNKKLKKLVWKEAKDFNADEYTELQYETTIDGYLYKIDCNVYNYSKSSFVDNYIDVFDFNPMSISPKMNSKLYFEITGNLPCVRKTFPMFVMSVIEHEMMHAYQDQKMIHDEFDLRLFNAYHTQYDIIQKIYNASTTTNRCKMLCDVIYQTFPNEIAAYTQSFDAELRKCKKLSDVDKCMKETQLYMRNMNLKKVIQDMDNQYYDEDDGVKSILSYLNVNKIKLQKKFEKIYDKINHRMYSLVLRRKDILSEIDRNVNKGLYEQYKVVIF